MILECWGQTIKLLRRKKKKKKKKETKPFFLKYSVVAFAAPGGGGRVGLVECHIDGNIPSGHIPETARTSPTSAVE